MSISYNPRLEGYVLPQIMSTTGPRRRKQLPTGVQKYLKEYLLKIKNLQPIQINTDNADGAAQEKAFVKALEVLDKWATQTDIAKVAVDARTFTASLKNIHHELANYEKILHY